jgi:hypothetical protein
MMKVNVASNILKVLLILFAIGAIFFGAYVLPIMAEQMLVANPELDYAKMPILIICELLLVMLLIGIVIILYLLRTFDQGNTFSQRFTRGMEILFGMCIIASIGLILLLGYMRSFGGPGPLLGIVMTGVIFLIWIVAAVTMLVRSIVKKAMVYKDDYDLTV